MKLPPKKDFWLFIGILFLFLLLRLPGVHAPYHQDEYKWPQYANPALYEPGSVPHPPLTELLYRGVGHAIGYNNFRYIPLVFSVLNLFLLFWLVSILFDKKTAFISTILFSISFYSVLASLMVDVDGAVMPFFFLILFIGYLKWKESNWKNIKWLLFLIVGAIGGFLLKLSGVLPLGAITLDFASELGVFKDKKKLLKYVGGIFLLGVALVLVLFLAKIIFPFFNIQKDLVYWEHFWNSSSFLGRGWFQTFIQFAKSILYTSPLLLVPIFFIDKEIFKKTRPFFLFIFVGLFFYLVIFDFSIGALDRYFQFLVIPLCVISGAIYAKYLEEITFYKKSFVLFGFLALIIFAIQFIHHGTPPLYPKTEWLSRMKSFKWNFLYPFSGGSGPLPFYISFAFMAIIWAVSIFLGLISKTNKVIKSKLIIGVIILGVLYNGVFVEEYLFGKINGSSRKLVEDAALYIKNNSDVKKVTVYNDNGGWNIMETGKYRRRLYIDLKFDITEKVSTINQYKEHYLVIDIPHIDPLSVYGKYFATCTAAFAEKSGAISGTLYDCRKAPDIKI